MSEEQVKTNQQAEKQPANIQPKKTYGWLILGLFNLILILVLAGGVFFIYQDAKEEQAEQSNEINKVDLREIEASKQFNAFQGQLATLQSQLATMNEELAGKDNHFNKTLDDFSDLYSEKQETIRKKLFDEINLLKRQLGKTRGDWLLADAEYLLSVANQRLHLVGDVKTTMMALEAADQRLRESGDTGGFKVREQLSKEIASLKTVKQPDIIGMYSSIQSLKQKTPELAVLLPYPDKPLTESAHIHDHDDPEQKEHGLLGTLSDLMGGVVTIKHSDMPVNEILSKEQVQFIKEQMNVKLEMIKISLIQQNDEVYKSSISDAKNWLKTNFTPNTLYNRFKSELDKYGKIQLKAQYPDISLSLKMLRDITKLRIETDKAQIEAEPTSPSEDSSLTQEPEVTEKTQLNEELGNKDSESGVQSLDQPAIKTEDLPSKEPEVRTSSPVNEGS